MCFVCDAGGEKHCVSTTSYKLRNIHVTYWFLRRALRALSPVSLFMLIVRGRTDGQAYMVSMQGILLFYYVKNTQRVERCLAKRSFLFANFKYFALLNWPPVLPTMIIIFGF
jgi:hypothetical protein